MNFVPNSSIDTLNISPLLKTRLKLQGINDVRDLENFANSYSLKTIPGVGPRLLDELEKLFVRNSDTNRLEIGTNNVKPTIRNKNKIQKKVNYEDYDEFPDLDLNNFSKYVVHLPLPRRIKNALLRGGITTVNRLLQSIELGDLYKVRNLGEKGINFLETYFQEIHSDNLVDHLQEISKREKSKSDSQRLRAIELAKRELSLNKLHVDVKIDSVLIGQIANNQNTTFSQKKFLDALQHPSIGSELLEFFSIYKKTYLEIIVNRIGPNKFSLEEIAKIHGVTRERVRQKEARLLRNLPQKIRMFPLIRTQTLILKALAKGDRLVFRDWAKEQHALGLVGKRNIDLHGIKLPTIEMLIIFNELILKRKTQTRFPHHDHLLQTYKDKSLSLRNIQALKHIPKIVIRQVSRTIRLTGAISGSDASNLLGIPIQQISATMKKLGFEEIEEDWFSEIEIEHAGSFTSQASLLNNVLRMLVIVDRLNIKVLHEGLLRAAYRHKLKVVPIRLLKKVLAINGFIVDRDIVKWESENSIAINGRDKIYLDLFMEFGPVVSFQEIERGFISAGKSRPLATNCISYSLFASRVEKSYYKVSGSEVSKNEIVEAKVRNENYGVSTDV